MKAVNSQTGEQDQELSFLMTVNASQEVRLDSA